MNRYLVVGKHVWSVANNPAKQGFRAIVIAESPQQILDTYDLGGITDVKVTKIEDVSFPIVLTSSHILMHRA